MPAVTARHIYSPSILVHKAVRSNYFKCEKGLVFVFFFARLCYEITVVSPNRRNEIGCVLALEHRINVMTDAQLGWRCQECEWPQATRPVFDSQ